MDKVGEQLPALGTALAGLILVFLGMIVSAWDGYDSIDRESVRSKYRTRIRLAFAGFLSALFSAGFGLYGTFLKHTPIWPDHVGLWFLVLSATLTLIVAFR